METSRGRFPGKQQLYVRARLFRLSPRLHARIVTTTKQCCGGDDRGACPPLHWGFVETTTRKGEIGSAPLAR